MILLVTVATTPTTDLLKVESGVYIASSQRSIASFSLAAPASSKMRSVLWPVVAKADNLETTTTRKR